MNRIHIFAAGLGLCAVVPAQAITGANGVNHPGPISTSITLSPANNPHVISGDVFVTNGATLTILPGVEFRSTQNSTLAITRGSMIIAEGTQDAPIHFTSSQETGVYRQNANNEWGNLTLMGSAYISEDEIPTNSTAPSSSNYADMEGLTPAVPGYNDYGGGDDNDDSGTLAFCCFRYGGLASIPGKELNGLSLGGIGRNTDIHHIEILNNIDDGIEVWGGTVNLKYISIWNVGDDSFDIDQGWRGKAQFGLLVQGASNTGAQGSGFGDNALEIDGAERCDMQPVTTAAIHNFTVIGGTNQVADPLNPSPTDELVEFRDNARVQFLNCIFMDAGKEVINDKVTDGEANNNTTVCGPGSLVPQLLTRMMTPSTQTYGVNAFPGAPELTPAEAYTAQDPAGNLVQFRGCIYYNNNSSTAYNEALSYGVFPSVPVAGTNHADNSIELSMPIAERTRSAAPFSAAGHSLFPVTYLDPLPVGPAKTAVEFSPNDGFFTSARYRGAFAPGNNWLIGWTAASQYGLTAQRTAGSNEPIHGTERPGAQGVPVLYATGNWAAGTQVSLTVENVQDLGGFKVALLLFATAPANPVTPTAGIDISFLNLGVDTLVPSNTGVLSVLQAVGGADPTLSFTMPPGYAGQTFYTQAFALDTGVAAGTFTSSNAQRHNL